MTNDGRLLIDITLPADYREIQELFYQVKRDGEGESPPRLKGNRMRYLVLSSVILAVLSLLTAPPTYTISGQVQDNTGKAASGVRVCAIAEDFDANKPNVPIPCAFSDPQGKFAITVDKASKYQLIYDDSPNGRHTLPSFDRLRPPFRKSGWVTITLQLR
jgi:hypothetical protein